MENTPSSSFSRPHVWLKLVGILAITAIVIVAVLRDRIVNNPNWTVSVIGRGVVSYEPDTAVVNVGVQVDRARTAEAALNDLNGRVKKIAEAMKALGIPDGSIATQNYSLYPQYDYINEQSVLAGYSANQVLEIKVTGLPSNQDQLSSVLSEATKAGANQVNGVRFEAASLDALKQQARIAALADARGKAKATADAAGVRLKKVVGWWENYVQAPDYYGGFSEGKGGGGTVSPTVPGGLQEVVIEVNVNYLIK